MKTKIAILTAVLLGMPTLALAQAKLAPAVATCIGAAEKEVADFDKSLKSGVKEGFVNKKEEEELTKMHKDTVAKIAEAKKDGKITADECKGMIDATKKESAKLAEFKKGRADNTCKDAINKESKEFEAALKKGKADGKIDAKEEADLTATHTKVMDALKKAREDGIVTKDECTSLNKQITDEHTQLKKALAERAGKSCMDPLNAGVKANEDAFNKGVAAKKIDAKEQAEIKKGHAELKAAIKKAVEDKKVTVAECKDLEGKVAEEKKKIEAALK
jgi:hypothetical protein